MSKKSDGEALAMLISLAAAALSSVFLINTIAVNRHFAKKYNINEVDIRVHDSGNILRFYKHMCGIGFLMVLGFSSLLLSIGSTVDLINTGNVNQNINYIIFGAVIGIISLASCFIISARIGTSQIGMLVFPEHDMFVIPADPRKNTFIENIFQGKLFTDMYKMEELPLSEVQKITREAGKQAFVHGKFGTRRISWRDKQKRDECIATLERACRKNLGGYDRGY